VGLALRRHPRRVSGQALRVGAVGLGAGTIAAYGKPGDYFRFYELNPDDIRLAYSGEPLYFTYLKDTPAQVAVIEGDARVSLEREISNRSPQFFDILVLDAFSGDAIPLHLLTKEAFAIYLRHLRADDSVLAFHISNDAVDLSPVLAGLSDYYKLHAIVVDLRSPGRATNRSLWMLMSLDEASLSKIGGKDSTIPSSSDLLWTDDFSNLFQVLK
jgi:hypothetical protein